MKDQPWDLNQPWPVQVESGVDLQMPPNILGPFPKFRAQKHQIFDHFLRLPHSTPHISVRKRPIENQNANVDQQRVP